MAELLLFLLGGVAGTWVGAAGAFALRHSKRNVIADIRRWGW